MITKWVLAIALAGCFATSHAQGRSGPASNTPKPWTPSLSFVGERTVLEAYPRELWDAVPFADLSKHPYGTGLDAALRMISGQEILNLGYPTPTHPIEHDSKGWPIPRDPGLDPRPSGHDLDKARAFFQKNKAFVKELIRLGKLPLEQKKFPGIPFDYWPLSHVLWVKAVVDRDDNRKRDVEDDLVALIRFGYAHDRGLFNGGFGSIPPYTMIDGNLSDVKLALDWGLVDEDGRKRILQQLPKVPDQDWWVIACLNFRFQHRDFRYLSNMQRSVRLTNQGGPNLDEIEGNYDAAATAKLMGRIAKEGLEGASSTSKKLKFSRVQAELEKSNPELFKALKFDYFDRVSIVDTDGSRAIELMRSTPNSVGLLWAYKYAKETSWILAMSRKGWEDWAKLRDLLENGN